MLSLPPDLVARFVEQAFLEDSPYGDITSDNLFDAEHRCRVEMRSREVGVFSGADVVRAAFCYLDPTASVDFAVEEGERFAAGRLLATIEGSARSVLRAERIALNFVQRMSGIATITRSFVDAVAHTNARIVDTRKTTPGLRALERYAVRCGGGTNHRFSLSEGVLVKDNHLAFLQLQHRDIAESLRALAACVAFTTHIEVEVDRLEQIEGILASGVVDSVLIDNFSVEDTVAAVEVVKGRALVNASGGISTPVDAVRVAEAGVDLISIGALTHSAPVVDIGLDSDEK